MQSGKRIREKPVTEKQSLPESLIYNFNMTLTFCFFIERMGSGTVK